MERAAAALHQLTSEEEEQLAKRRGGCGAELRWIGSVRASHDCFHRCLMPRLAQTKPHVLVLPPPWSLWPESRRISRIALRRQGPSPCPTRADRVLACNPLHGFWHVHVLWRGARVLALLFLCVVHPHTPRRRPPTSTPPLVLLPQVCLVGAGWALVALRPMAALAAPVRIEGFGAGSNEATPVLRRNPASLPNVMEAATALKVRATHPPSHGPSL